MRTELSRRITRLVSHADTVPPAVLKADLLDLAKDCQVVPENRFLLSAVAGQMAGAVSALFGPLALILLLTEPARRQVYFAVLAAMLEGGRLEGLTARDRAELITRLMTARNAELITDAFGSCPSGLLRLLSRLGDGARAPRYYRDLHALLTGAPDLAAPILAVTQGQALGEELLRLILLLPRTPLGVRVAVRFVEEEDYTRFLRPYRAVTGLERISEPHMERIAAGEAPGTLLEGLYLELPFPPPALGAPGLTHLGDGRALVRAAREFSNCLAGYVAEALRGERQYYVWREEGEADVVLSISNEGPFGWYLSECRLAGNERVPIGRRKALHRLLEPLGVRTGGSVEKLMGPYREDPDTFLLEHLFDEEEAA